MNKWHTIKGYEDYEITKSGRIRKKHHQKEFTFTPDKDGYSKTALRKDGKRHYLRAHRLVADTFIPNPNNLPLVNHKNGKKDDNSVDNLEWVTYQQNVLHGFEVLGRKGHNGGTNKRVAKVDPITGEVISNYNSIAEANKAHGLKSVSINHVINGRSETAAGYKWVFIE